MFDEELLTRATRLLQTAAATGRVVATAESCTGGLLAGLLTSVAGASQVFHGGIVVYDNSWKENILGVSTALFENHGAVSGQVAEAMASGVFSTLKDSAITDAVAITGIAGDESPYQLRDEKKMADKPSNKLTDKPVGLVFIAVMEKSSDKMLVEEYHFAGDRETIRRETLLAAIDLLERLWQDKS